MPSDALAQGNNHQSLMDKIYSKQRHIYDLSRKYYLLGRDHLIADMRPPQNGSILEIGCGTGRNLICASREHQDAQIYGIDISTEMLKSAKSAIGKNKLTEKITIAQADATNFDPEPLFGKTKFDCIFISYSVSMMPCWREAIAHALTMLEDDGALHIVDFGQQTDMPAIFKTILLRWLAIFHVTPRAELLPELTTLSEAHNRPLVFKKLHKDYTQYFKLTAKRS